MGRRHEDLDGPPSSPFRLKRAASSLGGNRSSEEIVVANLGRKEAPVVASGALMNPAATLAFALIGHISFVRMVFYMCFQLLGALLGAFILLRALGEACYDNAFTMEGYSRGGVDSQQRILIDTMCSCLLVLMQLWSSKRMQSMATPILIGFTYLTCTMFSYPITGMGNFNPCDRLGSRQCPT